MKEEIFEDYVERVWGKPDFSRSFVMDGVVMTPLGKGKAFLMETPDEFLDKVKERGLLCIRKGKGDAFQGLFQV